MIYFHIYNMKYYEIHIYIYFHIYMHIHIQEIFHMFIYIYGKQNTSEGENQKYVSRLTMQKNPISSTYYLHSRMLIHNFHFHPLAPQ